MKFVTGATPYTREKLMGRVTAMPRPPTSVILIPNQTINSEKRITRKQLKVCRIFFAKGGSLEIRAVMQIWVLFLEAMVQPM
jgi:hypothetical protein